MKLWSFLIFTFLIISFSTRGQSVNPDDSLLYEVNKGFDEIDVKRVIGFVKAGGNPNVSGESPVIDVIAAKGTADDMLLVLKKGARINPKEQYMEGPMFKAVEYRNIPVMKILIEKGIDLARTNIDGYTALEYTIIRKDTALFNMLNVKGGNYNPKNEPSILYKVVTEGDSAMAKFLIRKGAAFHEFEASEVVSDALSKPNSKAYRDYMMTAIKSVTKISMLSSDGFSAIHYAAYTGDIDMIKLLLKKGVKLNTKDYQDNTALHYAIANKQDNTARYLLTNGIASNDALSDGGIALTHLAAITGNLSMLQELLKRGNKITFKDSREMNTLSYALMSGNLETIEFVLNQGIKPGDKDIEGYTPRNIAVFLGDINILELVMKDYNAQTDDAVSLLTDHIFPEQLSFGPIEGMKVFKIPANMRADVKEWLVKRGVKPPSP
jgi:ankyrin repeat protein